MESIIETIKKRYSARNYSNREIEKDKLDKLSKFISDNTTGPFNNPLRFQIINVAGYDGAQLKELGVYGQITGAKIFIAGAVKTGNHYMEDFGYAMEKNILFATSLDLNTVWLGGTLNRSTFGQKMNVAADEMMIAITPVGYAGEKTIRGKIMESFMQPRKRKKPEELFFLNTVGKPLSEPEQGEYASALESVRLGPSASNYQPWRIIKAADKNSFHFYEKENKLYHRILKGVRLQDTDLGIAMCHFELTAQELGLKGKWETKDPNIADTGLNYIVTWVGEK
jgi:nitroreductase